MSVIDDLKVIWKIVLVIALLAVLAIFTTGLAIDRETEQARRDEMHRLARAFEQTVGGVANTVAAAAAQMQATAQSMTRIADDTSRQSQAAGGTRAASSGVASVTASAEQAGQAAGEVLEASNELSRQAEHLRVEVGRFITQVRSA